MSSAFQVTVANGQGFWGDTSAGPAQLVERAQLDYLTLDYLAEVTMSILHKQRARDPQAGYATDFVAMLRAVLPQCAQKGTRVVSNAGGVNPGACARAVAAVAMELALPELRIAVVEGDDMLAEIDALLGAGEPLCNVDSGQPLTERRDDVRSANVYLGAAGITDALAGGADIVITGRCTDAALTIGPLVHELGWAWDDYDRLAAATVAGHVIECGTQATGGILDDWRAVGDFTDMGFPLAEVEEDGTVTVTKPPGTGGRVSVDSVTAQLLYEIGDPRHYAGPDVCTDFTTLTVSGEGPDRVRLSGARGHAPTDTYKVSVAVHAGWKAVGQLTVAAPGAVDKARLCADVLFRRLAREGVCFAAQDTCIELLGAGALWPVPAPVADPPEVVLRIAVRSADKRAVARFGSELAPLLTSGPPGLTGFAGGRPRPSELVGFWPALVRKDRVQPQVHVAEAARW